MKAQFIFFFLLIFIASCTKDNDSSITQLDSQMRSVPNMQVKITKSNREIVTYTSSKVAINYINSSYCQVIVNYGMANQFILTALEASITEPDNQLRLIKNPGVNQTIYLNKYSAKHTISTSSLEVLINPGAISTPANSIIGEEDDQI
ncbi:MAG: hypothetical protein RLZZ546_574 [Bacteroidota bacterium]|jgi:hypothetical protein